MLKIDPNISIFIQLADHIRLEIYSFKRKPGSKLESIREMALILEVNPNTIKRVYQELEDEGIIYTTSTSGFYVIEDIDKIKQKRDFFIKDKFIEFWNILKICNLDIKETIDGIRGDINENR